MLTPMRRVSAVLIVLIGGCFTELPAMPEQPRTRTRWGVRVAEIAGQVRIRS